MVVASSTACQYCAAGMYSTALGASSSGTCQACGAGTVSTQSGASSSLTCQTCVEGSYSSGTGIDTACVACQAGTYATATGSTAPCLSTPPPITMYLVPVSVTTSCSTWYCGATSEGETGTCASAGCESGCSSPQMMYDNSTATTWNPAGCSNTFYVDFDYGAPVTPQLFFESGSPGDSTHDTGTWLMRITSTPGSGYQDVQSFSGLTPGTNPKPMYFSPLTTLSSQYWGFYVTGLQYQIYVEEAYFASIFCPLGFYMLDNSACAACPAGQYATANGMGTDASVVCQSCPPGTYATGGALTASSACLSCAFGSYASGSGMSACSECAAGTYSSSSSMVVASSAACQYCLAGFFFLLALLLPTAVHLFNVCSLGSVEFQNAKLNVSLFLFMDAVRSG